MDHHPGASAQHHDCDAADVLVWSTRERILCEVRARPGRLTDPFLGFQPPGALARPDDGLWETRQICEFVDLRSGSHEAEWRIRMEAVLARAG